MKKSALLASLLLIAATGKDQLARFSGFTATKSPLSGQGLKKTKQTKGSVADVVTLANAFIATLSSSQQSSLIQAYNSTNVTKWSNLPVSNGSRLGLPFSSLSAAQQAAALAVVQAATGTAANEGYNEIQQLRAADDNLNANGGGNMYGAGVYLIAFLGTPSTTGTWEMQFGGHHLATTVTFSNGNYTGATPKFEGVEPLTFTTNVASTTTGLPAGTYSPLGQEEAAMASMLNGLTTAQKTTAHLSQTFGDVVLGPNGNGQFPATKVGLRCNTLTSTQQALVVDAMRPWVNDAEDTHAAAILAHYQAQLNDTYVSYSGTGNFTSQSDYVRIDGPNVWIELVCQGGIVYRNQIHYHTIWRDHGGDYGGNFYTVATATKAAAAEAVFSVYPSPTAGQSLTLTLATPASATYTLRNMLGQTVATQFFTGLSAEVPTVDLPIGTYLLSVQTAGNAAVTRKVVVN